MKLHISKNLNYDIDKTRLASEFVIFCADHLPIEKDYEVYIVSDRENSGIETTAVYEMGRNICKIYGKNRAFVDVLRSIAHEMTHMMQDEMGLLVGHIRDAGGFHEYQANAKAGELIKLFAKSKKDRKAIYENKKVKRIKEVIKLKQANYADMTGMGKIIKKTGDPGGGPGSSQNFGRADVEGDKFTLGGVKFIAMPTPDVASKAESLVASAKSAAKAGGDPYVDEWEASKSGKKWLRRHMWNDAPGQSIRMKPGSGNYQDRPSGCAKGLGKKYKKTDKCADATDVRSAWSGNFWKRSHENYIEPKKADGGNGISNLQSEYNWADAARVRKRVFANPESFIGKVVWMVFKPSEKVPINRGDSVVTNLYKISGFDQMHTSNYKGIAASGNSHMNVITKDGGGAAVGGNLSDMAKSGKSTGVAYYKRVKILGVDKKIQESKLGKAKYSSMMSRGSIVKKTSDPDDGEDSDGNTSSYAGSGNYLVPPSKGLYGPVLEKYKNRKSKNRYPGKPRGHNAYDWAMPEGAPYFAVADGVVTNATANNSWKKKFKWYKGSIVYDNFPGMKKQSMSVTSGPKDMKGLSGLSSKEKASWEKARTAKKGTVRPKEFNKGGNGISIKHIHPETKQPFYTYCGHLKDVYVKKGDKVKGGQKIGTCGSTGRSTGPHFHWKLQGFEGSKSSDKSAYDRFLSRCTYIKEK